MSISTHPLPKLDDTNSVSMDNTAVVLVGHGSSASSLLLAAKGIVPSGDLDSVIAVDAGEGESRQLNERLCAVFDSIAVDREILLIVDLLGASPCMCGRRLAQGHQCIILTGLNLATLLKLASANRRGVSARQLADACAESAKKSICVEEGSQ